LVVLASANHFLLDAAGGLAVLGLGLLGTAGNSGRGLALSREPQRQRRRSGDSCVSRPGPVPGPLYTAILRHAVLVMAALAICAVTAALLKDRTDTQDPPRSPLIRPRRPNKA
jgi:hypothetical protein